MSDMQYSVSIGEIIDTFALEVIFMPEGGRDIRVLRADLNRPGLALVGFTDGFDSKRLILVSRSEIAYMKKMEPELRHTRLNEMLSLRPPGIIVARGVAPSQEMMAAARRYDVPLIRSYESSTVVISKIFEYLSMMLAPRVQFHGGLVEVYGLGVLILGESGIGKSETAVELILRGHRLVADDMVIVKRLPGNLLQGEAPEAILHFIELRGVGVLDVRQLFGMSAVKMHENIMLVVQLELWQDEKAYDRLGMLDETFEILGVQVPIVTIPVRPGRNLASIVEVAAMNTRMKMMGHNSAVVLDNRILQAIRQSQSEKAAAILSDKSDD